MSDNNNQPKISVECPKCSQRFSVEMPQVEFFNNLYTSGCAAPHQQLTRCPNARCRQPFILFIVGAQVTWGASPLSDEVAAEADGSRIVKPTLTIN